jgi:hypothetical protein
MVGNLHAQHWVRCWERKESITSATELYHLSLTPISLLPFSVCQSSIHTQKIQSGLSSPNKTSIIPWELGVCTPVETEFLGMAIKITQSKPWPLQVW